MEAVHLISSHFAIKENKTCIYFVSLADQKESMDILFINKPDVR